MRSLFRDALERPHEARRSFLDQAVGDDSSLKREVFALLEAHEQTQSFLVPSDPDPGPDPLIGRSLGNYKILHLLGRGGMGAVYAAERADSSFRLQVAVKIVAHGPVGPEHIRRFHLERQILAALNHPNIARLLDGGETEEGLPFLVMERVEGRPIDEFCASRGLTTRERIELFRQVCSAVQFAHQNLVVHRDLKPQNILVTPEGVPKLLDFGIAKLLNPDLSSSTEGGKTWIGRPLTPSYASPEQLLGEPITTASDIYALGILFFELLSGERPFDVDTSSPGKFFQSVIERQPPLMSRVVARASPGRERPTSTRELSRGLQGDLDNIALTALRREPQRRYGSVEQMSEDLERFLENRPVRASGDSLVYRLRKWVRRHRLATAVALGIGGALTAFGVTTARHRDQLEIERDRAREGWAQAREVKGVLAELFQVADPMVGEGPFTTAQELLSEGERLLQSRLARHPEARAELLAILGRTYTELGDYPKAEALLAESLEIRKELERVEPSLPAHGYELFGRLRLNQSRYTEAEKYFRQALDIFRSMPEPDQVGIGDSLSGLAKALQHQGQYASAEQHFQQALKVRERAHGVDDLRSAESVGELAGFYWYTHRFEEAEPLYRRTLNIFRRAYGPDHLRVSFLLNDLGNTLEQLDRSEEAEQLLRKALEIRRHQLGELHPRVATSLNSLASLLKNQKRYDEAEPLFRRALEVRQSSLEPGHRDIGLSRHNLASVLSRQKKYQEAELHLERARAELQAALGADHPYYAFALKLSADVCAKQERYGEALELLTQARGVVASQPTQRSFLAAVWVAEAKIHLELDRPSEAHRAVLSALDLFDGLGFPSRHRRVLAGKLLLGRSLTEMGRRQEAEATLESVVSTIDALGEERAADLAAYRTKALKRLAEARQPSSSS